MVARNMARTRANLLLRWTRYLLFAAGTLALGYVAFAVVDADLYQAYQTWRFQKALREISLSRRDARLPDSLRSPGGNMRLRTDILRDARRAGSPLGRIEIGSIGLAAMIAEGTDEGTLRRAVGHIPGTALPGQPGNVAIAGHRDTFFRPLRKIRRNDEITLTTLNGFYRYRVDYTEVVSPRDIQVLDPSRNSILTLVTCYPFYFIGSAPERFIVRAHRIP